MNNKKLDNSDTVDLQFCIVHDFGAVTKDSERQKEHIKESNDKCKWEKYNPKKHNPKYDESKIQDDEEKPTPTKKVLYFAESKIIKTVRSYENHSNIYGIIKINGNYKVLFLNSTECIQWLKSTYFDHSGKIHSNDLYKNALGIIIARAITNEIKLQKIYNRIAFVDSEIFYNLCNDDYEIVKINKDGYNIIKNGLDNPLFRRKSSPLPQFKPRKYKNRNPLNELAELLRIPFENKQLFIIHLVSFFIEKYPIPIMILHGEKGSAKSTITATVKKIVDPSPGNRNSMPESIDDVNIHFFNRYLTNFDNISYIDSKMSDNLCKVITGHTHNKRELYSDDGEVILTIKARVLLNGITPNVEYTDLMDRSIFYESKILPKSETLTDEEFDKKTDELLPYLLHQIFNTISNSLKIYDSVKPEITHKERMADFTVIGECISRSLGYENFTFIESYKNNLKLNSFNANESWPIINIVLDIARKEGKDFEISVYELYDKIMQHAYDSSINPKSKNSKFPQNEKALSNQMVRLSSSFRNSGYDITSYRYNPRDGKYARNTRIFKIICTESFDSGTTDGIITNYTKNGKSVEPVEPVSQTQKQARNHSKNGSTNEYGKRASEPAKKTKKTPENGDKNTVASIMTHSEKQSNEPKNTKSVPKNGTDSVAQLNQPKSQSLGFTKNSTDVKRYSHFKCTKCNFGDFIRIDSKSRISDDTLHDIHKREYPTHKLEYSNGDNNSS